MGIEREYNKELLGPPEGFCSQNTVFHYVLASLHWTI